MDESHIISLNLHRKVLREDKSIILAVLQYCYSINKNSLRTQDNFGNTLLHLVLKNEKLTPGETLHILKVLLEQKVDPNIQNNKGVTPLHIAVGKGNTKFSDLLIKNGANVSKLDNQGNTAAHYFIESEHEKYKKSPQLTAQDFRTCDRERIEKESNNFVKWLIDEGFDFDHRNNKGTSPLQLAMKSNLQHILPILLKHCTDINFLEKNNQNLLYSFLKMNGLNRIDSKFSKFTRRYTVEIVKILLNRGVSVDTVITDGNTALHLAFETNEAMDILELLLDRFTNVHHKNKLGQTLLHQLVACQFPLSTTRENYLKIISTLIKKGSDVNEKDDSGMRPIHLVVDQRHFIAESLNLLVKAGCDLNATDNNEMTALHLATSRGKLPIIQALIQHGADVNCENHEKMTPLLMAVEKRLDKVVEVLLNENVDVNCKDIRHGQRPLHLYAERYHDFTKNRKRLLRKGAYVNVRDNNKRSPLSRAVKYRNSVAVKDLLAHGAEINDPSVIEQTLGLELSHWNCRIGPAYHISKQWIKLRTVNLPSSKEYLKKIKIKRHDKLYHACLQEIEKMKNILIDNRTTLYAWLQMNPNRRCIYTSNNEELKKMIHSAKLMIQFPEYYNLLFTCYREMVLRKTLLEPAKIVWYELTEIGLPDICVDHIFSYLGNEDLLDILEK